MNQQMIATTVTRGRSGGPNQQQNNQIVMPQQNNQMGVNQNQSIVNIKPSNNCNFPTYAFNSNNMNNMNNNIINSQNTNLSRMIVGANNNRQQQAFSPMNNMNNNIIANKSLNSRNNATTNQSISFKNNILSMNQVSNAQQQIGGTGQSQQQAGRMQEIQTHIQNNRNSSNNNSFWGINTPLLGGAGGGGGGGTKLPQQNQQQQPNNLLQQQQLQQQQAQLLLGSNVGSGMAGGIAAVDPEPVVARPPMSTELRVVLFSCFKQNYRKKIQWK